MKIFNLVVVAFAVAILMACGSGDEEQGIDEITNTPIVSIEPTAILSQVVFGEPTAEPTLFPTEVLVPVVTSEPTATPVSVADTQEPTATPYRCPVDPMQYTGHFVDATDDDLLKVQEAYGELQKKGIQLPKNDRFEIVFQEEGPGGRFIVNFSDADNYQTLVCEAQVWLSGEGIEPCANPAFARSTFYNGPIPLGERTDFCPKY